VACEGCWLASSARLRKLQLTDRSGSVQLTGAILDALCAGTLISASLVVSDEGLFVDPDGVSLGISSTTDRAWLAALRRNCEVVLTSGKTYRAEGYRMPKSANLAVISREFVDTSDLVVGEGRLVHVLGEMRDVSDAIRELGSLGYSRIHVEFGPTAMRDLLASGVRVSLYLSGPSQRSLEQAARALGASIEHLAQVDDLHLGLAR
jgi:hypothetical protein